MSDDQHQVVLMNHTVFQPRGVSCVSELDIAHLNNKQYIRKSYLSNMDLSKDLQLDANVFDDDKSVPMDNLASAASSSDDSKGKGTSTEHKTPPPKPPRTPKAALNMSLSLVPDKMVIVPTRSWQGEGQSRCVLSPTDHHPSIVEAGSRVSSFAPRSSFSKPRGHSRSKSETLNPAMLDMNTKEHTHVIGETMLNVPKQASRSPSPTSDSLGNKSPTLCTKVLPPHSPRSPSPSNSHGSHITENIKALHCTLPRLVIGEKGTITGNVHRNHPKQQNICHSLADSENADDDSKQATAAEVESISHASKMQYNSILKELDARSFRATKVSPLTPAVEREEATSDIQDRGQYTGNKPLVEETFPDQTITRMAKLNQSQKAKQTPWKRHRKHSADDIIDPQVRKSSFITHDDEVGSILEEKPLSSLAQLASETEWAMMPVLRPFVMKGFSGLDTLTKNDDSEEVSRSCFYGSDDQVDEADLPDKEGYPIQPLSPPPETYRLSNITENLSELSDSIVREGFLQRTFLMRDNKKVRKNWTHSYTRYIVRSFNSDCSGILYFSKTKDEEKKPEIFEFFPPCSLEHASDKKTSRQLVLGLRNGHETEVLLQFEDKDIAQEWLKVLSSHEGIEYNESSAQEKEDKKGRKGSEKIKRETSVEQLSPDTKGIKDKLRNFIRRRPMKETLENKGIYKESVFGSTLAELKSQDKTNIPIFVLQCINNIEKNDENLKTDGLYRISGNAAQIQKIRFEVAQRKYAVLSEEKEIHNLSGALKLFFRELKEPLIPYENYEDFIRATGSEYRRMNQQADKLLKAVNKLPVENRDTLKLLMQHLLQVNKFESENRMSLSNLAIVFGPCLMWPKVTLSHDLMTDVMLHNRVVEGLLSDFAKIFTKR